MGADEKIPHRLFLRVKPSRILCSLRGGPKYATILSGEVGCAYSYTVNMLKAFGDSGLVSFDRTGRIKMVSLTDSGLDISASIENLMLKLDRMKGWKSG